MVHYFNNMAKGKIAAVTFGMLLLIYVWIYRSVQHVVRPISVKSQNASKHSPTRSHSAYIQNSMKIPQPESSTSLFSNVTTTRTETVRAYSHSSTLAVSQYINLKSFPGARRRNVFYNRIGKCGSRSLLMLAQYVMKRNNIRMKSSANYWDDHPHESLAMKEMMKISTLAPPTFYNRHIHYLDFKKHRFKPPIYINMIRDPVSRYVSHFNYAKYGDMLGGVRNGPANLSDINHCLLNNESYCHREKSRYYYTNYFCGFDSVCSNTSSTARFELAKKHVRDDYLLIGMTEEFEHTLALLEKMIPVYFKGASDIWKRLGGSLTSRTKTKTKDVLNDKAYHKLRYEILADDYIVYEYAKSKYQKLKKEYGIS